MTANTLRAFLDREGVKYVTLSHSPAFTAQEIAAAAHVRGHDLAKTVLVRIDGELAMAVLPASYRIDLEMLREALGARSVGLAGEAEFRDRFPDCEVGAMPPFGILYGLPVYVAESLAEDEEIAFNAGTHTELFRVKYRDFARLVRPRVARFSVREAFPVPG